MFHKINRDQRLYVLKESGGFSCLGFDVCHKRTAAYAEWLKRPDLAPPPRKGTAKAYRAYKAALAAVFERYKATGQRCPSELTPELIGLEGKRVCVTLPDGTQSRFIVGKSTGWVPIHLEIKRRDSSGGGAVYFPKGAKVTVLHA